MTVPYSWSPLGCCVIQISAPWPPFGSCNSAVFSSLPTKVHNDEWQLQFLCKCTHLCSILIAVSFELFDYIVKLHQEALATESLKWSHITFASKLARQLYTHPTAIKLKDDVKLEAFAEDARNFATFFHEIWPNVSFCNIHVLQFVIPDDDALHAITQALLNCVSLCRF